MTDAEFGQEIKAARERKGWLQKELAWRLCRKAPLVCGWEKGNVPPQRDDVRLMVREFDDYGFDLAVTAYYTSSVLGFRFDAVDGGRAGAAMLVQSEIQDVVQAIEAAKVALMTPPQDEEREVAWELCLELLEAKAAINEKVRRLTEEYGVSAAALAKERQRRAYAKGYAKRKNRQRSLAA